MAGGAKSDSRWFESTVPHEGFSVKNQHWQAVQKALLSLFRRESLDPRASCDLHSVYESLAVLKKSDIGPLIPEYYKAQLLTKAMSSLRQKLDALDSYDYLMRVADDWLNLKNILPSLELIFYDFKELKVRQVTLQQFRDRYVVRENQKLREAVESSGTVLPEIENMYYILCDMATLNADRCSPSDRPLAETLQFFIDRRRAALGGKLAPGPGSKAPPNANYKAFQETVNAALTRIQPRPLLESVTSASAEEHFV